MNQPAEHISADEIEFIPLSQLKKSNTNMRQQETNGADDKTLKASMAAFGVLQNLIVHPAGKNYGVAGGDRRLKILKELAKEGTIEPDYQVPCRVVDKDNAIAMSIAENTIRVKPHPVDEFMAFQKLVESGVDKKAIALEFGVDARYVNGRLALSAVHPKILEDFRKGEFEMDVVQAFTTEPDQKRQLKVYKTLSAWQRQDADRVKDSLHDKSLTNRDSIVNYVTIKAYTKAGGMVTEDFFSKEVILHDVALVTQLAEQRIQIEIEKLEKAGWDWVKSNLDRSVDYYRFNREYGRIKKADRSKYGVVVEIGLAGNLKILEGFYTGRKQSSGSGTSKDKPKKAKYSQALTEDLGKIRQAAVRQAAADAEDQSTLCNFATFVMTYNVFSNDSHNTGCLAIAMGSRGNDYLNPGPRVPQFIHDSVAHIPMIWNGKVVDCYQQYSDLSLEHKVCLLNAAVASTLTMSTYRKKHSELINLVSEQLGVDYLKYIKLTGENFFSRISKPEQLAIIEKVLSADRAKDLKNKKKAELTEFLDKLFNVEEAWTAEGLVDGPAYLPEGFTEEIS